VGKANVVADALSRKKHCNVMSARELPLELCREFEELSLAFMNELSAAKLTPPWRPTFEKGS
jgi:hypothetical protein